MRVTSCPLMRMVPLVALSMVETQLSNVDLPEPEAPMMPTNSPRLTVKLASLSARVTLPSAPYTFFEMRDLQYRGRHVRGLHTESFLCD